MNTPKKIPYEVNELTGRCNTPCSTKEGWFVGSFGCRECEYIVAQDQTEKYVLYAPLLAKKAVSTVDHIGFLTEIQALLKQSLDSGCGLKPVEVAYGKIEGFLREI